MKRKLVQLNLVEEKTTLNDVYIKISNQKLLNFVLYDKENIYCNSSDYLNRSFVDYDDSALSDNYDILCDNNALCLLTQEAVVPSHNYEQFVRSYCDDMKKNNLLILYETDNVFYNSFVDFITKYILKNDKTIKIKKDTVYKLKSIEIYHCIFKNDKNMLNYAKSLDVFIDDKHKKNYYNIKFDTDKHNWTGSRSFVHCDKIIDVLSKHSYSQINTFDEYTKQINLQNSNKLILTYGGNHHINMIMSLYGKNKNVLILCHISYKNEYINSYVYKNRNENNCYIGKNYGNNVMYVFDLDSKIDNFEKLVVDFDKYVCDINKD